jgi:Derlin-2/3
VPTDPIFLKFFSLAAPKMTNDILWGQVSQIPPITRYVSLAIAATTLLIYMEAVSPYTLFYSPLYLRRLELWRIVTCFLYFGKPTLDVLMHIVFLYRYSRMLEEGCMNTADYFWLITIISAMLFAIANIFSIPTLGASFSSTITYIWTKRNPRAIVQIFGFISFPAFYLPFILPGFMLLAKKSILIEDVLGIIVGHLFYYFKDVYPRWGYDVLRTPCWLKKLFEEHSPECKACRGVAGSGVRIGPAKARRASESNTRVEDESGLLHETDAVVEMRNEALGDERHGTTSSVAEMSGIVEERRPSSGGAPGLSTGDEGTISRTVVSEQAEEKNDQYTWDNEEWVVDSSDEAE